MDWLIEKDWGKYKRIFVLSDIHGNFELFNRMLKKIMINKEDLLIINGDSIDRGKDSNQIFDKINSLKNSGVEIIHLIGNHEDMLLNYLKRKDVSWLFNGGYETIKSYEKNKNIFIKHIEFIKSMPLALIIGKFLIVHAGIDPDKKLEEQERQDMLWIRDRFINVPIKHIDKTIIFGHSIRVNGYIEYFDNNTIGIDCGSYFNFRLGCIELKTMKEYYVSIN